LRDCYATATTETAADQLDHWMDQVKASACDPLKKALSAFGRWRKEIVAFFAYRISNGFVEGKNNRTKMMMRRSYEPAPFLWSLQRLELRRTENVFT
jgi:transposase